MKSAGDNRWLGYAGLLLLVCSCPTIAQHQDIHGPSGSGAFGTSIAVLPNGNFVVTDPGFSTAAASAVGAVYLYDSTGALVSKLTGSAANDRVGNGGVFVLQNGNFVVSSFYWTNNGVADAGAATWGSATVGVAGVVSSGNSLVGTHAEDQVSSYHIAALTNGNYVVPSRNWNGELGAATWGNGATGTVGDVSAANSLIGKSVGDHISTDGIFPLDNGNYVVASSMWQLGVGAATWCQGNGPTSAKVLPTNSLVGTQSEDFVGVDGVTSLPGGYYVVRSRYWWNGSIVQAGAATWSDKNGGTVGPVTPANSLVGTLGLQWVGQYVIALANGNYVVNSGAVTWAAGSSGITGEVSELNSFVASGAVQPLSDGNFIIASPGWSNAGSSDLVGAVTWVDGSHSVLGSISTGNSLIGTNYEDEVGNGGVAALSGGRYVFASTRVNDKFGVITIAGGNWPTSGTVTASNSMTGYDGNSIGADGRLLTALNDGNYVLTVDYSINPFAAWQSADAATSGAVAPDSSMTGTGGRATVTPAGDGNWILWSPRWTTNQLTAPNRGAVTLVHGGHPVSGSVGAGNSVVGGPANGGAQMVFGYDIPRDHLVVGRPIENLVTIFDGNIVFQDGFEPE